MALPLQIDTVRPYLNGQWLQVLAALVPELDAAIARKGRHVACPVHGGRDGFRLFKDAEYTGGGVCNTCGIFHDGFELLSWINGWNFAQSIEAIGQVLGIQPGQVPTRVIPSNAVDWKTKKQEEDKAIIHRLNQTWGETLSLTDTRAQPVWNYLHRRGIVTRLRPEWDSVLRFHPNLPYHDEDGLFIDSYPALLGKIVTQQGRSATFHRIYLSEDGFKAPVEKPKKMMPIPSDRTITGGAIPIGEPGEVLGVSEGIETALAMLYIWADHDLSESGLNAANELKKKAWQKGILTQVLIPPIPTSLGVKSWDWNDVLNVYGAIGFPKVHI
ncbi:DNA primase [Solemya velum gill symbiont]|uniref:DUF7146 domain-containing protein n=1 Tax=Solemya velum gill symbiont TaxID=2340 RepID=UPI0009963793|nr:primase-helicase zinc-binding domain-containing protein [Solemya velum gill symbiont]OOY49374.1 DNA primase [Solemya velum gill symbiont]